MIVGKAKSSRADYTPSEDDNMLVTGVEGSKYALGYFGFAYYEENQDRLKLLGVDPGDGKCVQPSLETVRIEYLQAVVAAAVHLRATRLRWSGRRLRSSSNSTWTTSARLVPAGRLRAAAGRRGGEEQAGVRRGDGGRERELDVVGWHSSART